MLLNDVISIWFTDKKKLLFTLATPKNSQVDRLYASAATKDKDRLRRKMPSHKNDVQSFTDGDRRGVENGPTPL